MTKYDWLLFLHVTGVFLFLGANVVALVLNVAIQLRDRPSEIVLLFRVMSSAVVGIAAVLGLFLLLGIGLWLVDEAGYGYGDGWIVAALLLFVLSNALGGVGGQRVKRVRELAERLAAEGDAPSAELKSMVRDPLLMLLNYGAGLLAFAVLALMIWKPGAGG
jgi:uncharacterized membrane protein